MNDAETETLFVIDTCAVVSLEPLALSHAVEVGRPRPADMLSVPWGTDTTPRPGQPSP